MKFSLRTLLIVVAVLVFVIVYWIPFHESLTCELNSSEQYFQERVLSIKVENSGQSSVWYLGDKSQITNTLLFAPNEEIPLSWQAVSPARWVELEPGRHVFLETGIPKIFQGTYILRFQISDWRGRKKFISTIFDVSQEEFRLIKKTKQKEVRVEWH